MDIDGIKGADRVTEDMQKHIFQGVNIDSEYTVAGYHHEGGTHEDRKATTKRPIVCKGCKDRRCGNGRKKNISSKPNAMGIYEAIVYSKDHNCIKAKHNGVSTFFDKNKSRQDIVNEILQTWKENNRRREEGGGAVYKDKDVFIPIVIVDGITAFPLLKY